MQHFASLAEVSLLVCALVHVAATSALLRCVPREAAEHSDLFNQTVAIFTRTPGLKTRYLAPWTSSPVLGAYGKMATILMFIARASALAGVLSLAAVSVGGLRLVFG
ncbi:MAG: hypothetical protein ACTHK2_16160 [Dokdonella sp.]|uniref:hypothetical protein n=1 Tax=Dokdonella sp. TaxID=2291710 RepID=UPI003F80E5B9